MCWPGLQAEENPILPKLILSLMSPTHQPTAQTWADMSKAYLIGIIIGQIGLFKVAKEKMTVWGTKVRSDVCNSWCYHCGYHRY